MKKLIFICHGNSLRSPIAEAIFNKNPKVGWKAYSYGTDVYNQKIEGVKLSESPYDLSIVIKEMKKRGMDISEKRSKQLFPEFLDDADKVIDLIEENYAPDWLLDKGYERWEIINPDTMSQKIAEEVINSLTEKIEILKESL